MAKFVVQPPREWSRIPVAVRFREKAGMAETYGFAGNQSEIVLEGQHFRPVDGPADTLYILMHPTSTLQMLPLPIALADAGLRVLCAASRYPKNDSALIMEKVAFDLGRYVDYAKEVLHYKYVVLVGWSGGGSLALFYQAEAEAPSITHTPAGDLYDLTSAHLHPADGVIFVAAHLSRAETLTEWLDPSVVDEADPDRRDMDFDIYGPGFRAGPPYTPAFVLAFRERQRLRNRKISDWALEMLDYLRRKNDGEMERAFVVHRTMCDVRWLDPTIDPNGRRPNWTYLGDPRIANAAPAGLARFSTLRSWLSQWSYEHSHVKAVGNAKRVRRTPVLQIENEADDAVPATHNPIVRDALATTDKSYIQIKGATHYYVNQPDQLEQCVQAIRTWSKTKGFA